MKSEKSDKVVLINGNVYKDEGKGIEYDIATEPSLSYSVYDTIKCGLKANSNLIADELDPIPCEFYEKCDRIDSMMYEGNKFTNFVFFLLLFSVLSVPVLMIASPEKGLVYTLSQAFIASRHAKTNNYIAAIWNNPLPLFNSILITVLILLVIVFQLPSLVLLLLLPIGAILFINRVIPGSKKICFFKSKWIILASGVCYLLLVGSIGCSFIQYNKSYPLPVLREEKQNIGDDTTGQVNTEESLRAEVKKLEYYFNDAIALNPISAAYKNGLWLAGLYLVNVFLILLYVNSNAFKVEKIRRRLAAFTCYLAFTLSLGFLYYNLYISAVSRYNILTITKALDEYTDTCESMKQRQTETESSKRLYTQVPFSDSSIFLMSSAPAISQLLDSTRNIAALIGYARLHYQSVLHFAHEAPDIVVGRDYSRNPKRIWRGTFQFLESDIEIDTSVFLVWVENPTMNVASSPVKICSTNHDLQSSLDTMLWSVDQKGIVKGKTSYRVCFKSGTDSLKYLGEGGNEGLAEQRNRSLKHYVLCEIEGIRQNDDSKALKHGRGHHDCTNSYLDLLEEAVAESRIDDCLLQSNVSGSHSSIIAGRELWPTRIDTVLKDTMQMWRGGMIDICELNIDSVSAFEMENRMVKTSSMFDFVYFAFTSLGGIVAGDIRPVSRIAKLIAIIHVSFIILFGVFITGDIEFGPGRKNRTDKSIGTEESSA
jgi:hypothetical protein